MKPEVTWDEVDCGARGNCGFNCLAVEAKARATGAAPLSVVPQADTLGRTLRFELAKEASKKPQNYAPFWKVDADATEATDAGKPPTTYKAWCEAIGKEGYYISALVLKVAAKRMKRKIVVVTQNEKDTLGYAVCLGDNTTEPPIVLILRSEHYTLAVPKSGKQLPQQWLSCDALLEYDGLRGAGPSWLPSDSASSAAPSWLPTRSAGSRQTKAGSIPASKRSRAPSWLPARSWGGSNSGAAATLKTGRPDLPRSKGPSASGPQCTVGHVTFVKSQEMFEDEGVNRLTQKRDNHISKFHPDEPRSKFHCMRHLVQILVPSADIPKELRAWTCPKCRKGLPHATKYELQKSKTAHLAACAPELSAHVQGTLGKMVGALAKHRAEKMKKDEKKASAKGHAVCAMSIGRKKRVRTCAKCTIMERSPQRLFTVKCSSKIRLALMKSAGSARLWKAILLAGKREEWTKVWGLTQEEQQWLDDRDCNAAANGRNSSQAALQKGHALALLPRLKGSTSCAAGVFDKLKQLVAAATVLAASLRMSACQARAATGEQQEQTVA